ncbi:RtcB family protein [Halomarina halobia]|uniref:RtcB family protein n=1 Tax=Halomarina halobia TaxID=3033386 RepID=UPI00361BFF86
MLEEGHATEADLEHCEEGGRLPGDPDAVPENAKKRGVKQVGSLGSGNHFLEVQRVTDVYDDATAAAYGLREDGVVVMIHSGSRGLGHQVCQEYIRRFERGTPTSSTPCRTVSSSTRPSGTTRPRTTAGRCTARPTSRGPTGRR